MSNNIYDIMKKLNAVESIDAVATPQKKNTTLLEATMQEVLSEKYMGFKAAASKKLGKNAKLSERVSVGAEYELDPADMPMPGNKLSPKDQFSAIMKDVEKVQSGARYPIGSMNNLRKDSDAGRFAAPGLGDQGQFFQEDDMEEGNLFTGNLAKARAAGKKRADLDGDGDMETVKKQGGAEGSKNKKISASNKPVDPKDALVSLKDVPVKKPRGHTQYDPAKEFPGVKAFKKQGVAEGSKNKKISASNKPVDPKDALVSLKDVPVKKPRGHTQYDPAKEFPGVKAFKKQGGAEGSDSLRGTNEPKKKDAWGEGYWVGHRREDRDCPYPPGSFDAEMWELGYHEGNKDRKNEMTGRVMEEKKTTKSGTVHKAKPGRYGGYDPETDPDKDEDDKKSEPAVKRGRGRPKKNADSDTGEVKKWDTSALQSAFGSNAPKKLPGKASVKHKMKDDDKDDKLDEVAPPGKKAERMVKNIKKGYAKDGKLTDKEKGIAYATTWKAHNKGKVEESIPPGFPKSLAKKIYEQCDGDIKNTLSTMWKVYNSVMESKNSSKKKISEGMKFEQSTTKPAMGTYKGGLWTADPPKKGEVGAPVPSPDEGAPVKQQSKRRPQKEDVSENKELDDVLKLAGMVDESVKVEECGMSPISGAYGDTMQDSGRMSINTNMSTDGNKTVTITADGDSAVELMQMLKMAGMDAKMSDEDTDMEKMSEEKDDRYEANTTPEEEVLPVQTQLKGGNGEVAGKEKKMTPHGYKFADNPLAMTESMTLKLMKEYESIKKVK